MPTLMTFKSANGSAERCDAKCYDARGSVCHCCCGGRNHGVGFTEAFHRTVDEFEGMVIESRKIKDPRLKVSHVKQNERFIRYFTELRNQACLFGLEIEDQLLERVKGARL